MVCKGFDDRCCGYGDMLAEKMQRNCSVKRSDVKAVLTELVEIMNDEQHAFHRVKLEGLGSFKIDL